jgi:outer membrane protein, heavy metal efflux system
MYIPRRSLLQETLFFSKPLSTGNNIKMLSTSQKLFFCGTLLSVATLLHATPAVNKSAVKASAQMIDLRVAVNNAFRHNPELKSFVYELKSQQGLESQAGMAASPELNVVVEDVLGSGRYSAARRAQLTLNIGWVLEGDIRQAYASEAQASTATASTELNIKRMDVAAETARLYLICLAYQAGAVNAEKTLKLAQETVIAVKKRVRAGKTTQAELSRAKADLAKQQLESEDLEHKLTSALHMLAAQWGELSPSFAYVEGDILSMPVPLSFAVLNNHLQQSPGFLRLLAAQQLQQAQLTLAESQANPEWQLRLGLRHFELTKDQALVAGISIPFGERARNRGRIAAARESLSQNLALQDELKVRFTTTLFVLFEELQHSLHRVETYRDQIIPRLETALAQTRRAYDLGRYSYLEWRSVQQELLDARTALIDDSINAHLKIIEIERLSGVSMLLPVGEK